ncbi:type II toxin-antitoxin system HicB family antitoxin [bacterium]|nr:type II toxin-antitoxin system HicB family antitoxin [FCB group bacterium]MBL7190074.1 type II toxin-antitoxin system HicB family antitoxin [bacterium]
MHRYLVIIEKADNNYAAYVPDLPGCAAAGKTVEETEKFIRKAVQLHIKGMKEDNLPIPEASTVAEYIVV